ncbi:MAG: putative blue pigment (indigoidine) exporter [Halovenus sp.]|jgi:probable blue pigment (indigoidine) exporter
MGAYRDGGLFVMLSVLWGASFVAIKAGLEHIPPVLFASLRYDIAGVLLLVYAALATDRWLPRSRADWVEVVVGSVLLIAAYNALLFVGEQGVTSGVAAILVATSPILTTGFSRLLLPDNRLTPLGLVGLACGFTGVVLVAIPDPSAVTVEALIAPGLVFLAAVSVALGSVLIERTEGDIGTEGAVAWSFTFGAVLMHVTSVFLPTESIGDLSVTVEAAVALGYLAVFASVVGYVIYFRLLDRLGAVDINLVSYVAPVVAAVVGWLVLGETLDPLTVVGFGVIALGFVLLKRRALAERSRRLRHTLANRG